MGVQCTRRAATRSSWCQGIRERHKDATPPDSAILQYRMPLPAGKGPNADLTPIIQAQQKHSQYARRSFNFAHSLTAFICQAAVHALADEHAILPPPLSRSLAPRSPKLVLLIASHCSSFLRLTKLRRCLASVAAQQQPGLWCVLVSDASFGVVLLSVAVHRCALRSSNFID